MEKGTRVRPAYLRHRCNSQRKIDEALAAGFDGVEIDLVWNQDGDIILSHNHILDDGPCLDDVDFRGCIVAVNIKEYGMGGQLSLHTAKDWFVFDVPGPELDIYCAAGHNVFGRISQWENQTLMPTIAGALLDDFTGCTAGQGALMLRTRLPVAMISNQLRGGVDSMWVMRACKYVICKEKPC